MKTYEEIIETIENTRRFGSSPGVEVTRRALVQLGEPMEGIPFLHVAGTNGKGSVCAFITEILRQAGVKTGTFTSPHLIRFEERIMVDGEPIAKEDVVRLGNLLLSKDFGVAPTMFDYSLLMAVLYFQEQGCEAAVIETGLGGRLDSTNALGTPEVAVLTQIGMDHEAVLGDSLEQIAREKAAIIKPGCFVVAEAQESPEIETVFVETVARCPGTWLAFVPAALRTRVAELPMRMAGVYQRENAAAAWLAAREFLKRNSRLSADRIELCCKIGISRTLWRGRMQVLSEEPFLMVDSAHNPQGVRAMAESLRILYPGERFHFLMGVMADKDYGTMIRELDDLADSFVTVTPESERAMQAEELAVEIRQRGIPADCVSGEEETLHSLSTEVKNVAFGSLYFVGELLEQWQEDSVAPERSKLQFAPAYHKNHGNTDGGCEL